MAKVTPSTAVADPLKQSGALAETMPAYLREQPADGDRGLALINQYVTPPMLKIVQKQSSDELQAEFGIGAVVVMPNRILLAPFDAKADRGAPFHVVPIFFYPEWLVTNPIEKRGELFFIRERSLDPRSDIALRARNRDTWYAPCPEDPKYSIRYVETLNFIVVPIGDSPLAGTPMTMSFARGEHGSGRSFAGQIQMRKAPHICCGVYEVRAAGGDKRKNQKGQWKGFDVSNPTVEGVSAWLEDQAKYEAYRKVYAEMKQAYDDKTLRTAVDDETVAAGGEDTSDPTKETRF